LQHVKAVIFSLYEGNYHQGVASLINSAIGTGFGGCFIVGYRDSIPPWAQTLKSVSHDEYMVGENRILFYKVHATRHLGYHKPFIALELLEKFPEIERLFYADPDVTFVAPWQFFDQWVDLGLALVEDSNFPRVSPNHPWRAVWKDLLDRAGLKADSSEGQSYVNSGFFGVTRRDRDFLKAWADVTLTFEATGQSTGDFDMVERWKAVVGDQDLLAAVMMHWAGPVSIMGPEAMGFTGYYFILSHAIESPKPWDKSYFLSSLNGVPPTRAGGNFLQAAAGPIQLFPKSAYLLRRLDYKAAKLVSRVWRRA
jgi:hypothetical protein